MGGCIDKDRQTERLTYLGWCIDKDIQGQTYLGWCLDKERQTERPTDLGWCIDMRMVRLFWARWDSVVTR